jgi:uncharacterized membrane protein YeaQ/YmgE (transglycosylase-associated protein family)
MMILNYVLLGLIVGAIASMIVDGRNVDVVRFGRAVGAAVVGAATAGALWPAIIGAPHLAGSDPGQLPLAAMSAMACSFGLCLVKAPQRLHR